MEDKNERDGIFTAQENWKPKYPLKLIYENNGLKIWQGPNVKNFGTNINRFDNVFYVETQGKVRYAKFDAVKMLEFLYINMILEKERELLRDTLRRTFQL